MARTVGTRRSRLHAVETARMLHALEDPPRRTQADIARETGRSPAYVSVLCRVGAAIRDLAAADQARLCQPHVTYTVLAALVGRHKQPDTLRAALQAFASRPPRPRAALRGAVLWGPGGGPAPSDDPLDPIPDALPVAGGVAVDGVSADRAAPAGQVATPVPGPAPGGRGRRVYAYTFDPADWRRDADAALADFEAHVRTLCEGVLRDAIRAVGADAGALGRLPAPPHAAGAAGAGAFARLSAQERAARFAGLELTLRQLEAGALATLRGHRAQLAAFETERALVREAWAGPGAGAGAVRDASATRTGPAVGDRAAGPARTRAAGAATGVAPHNLAGGRPRADTPDAPGGGANTGHSGRQPPATDLHDEGPHADLVTADDIEADLTA